MCIHTGVDVPSGAIVGIVCGVFGFYVGVMSGSASNMYWLLPLVAGGCGLHVQQTTTCICVLQYGHGI